MVAIVMPIDQPSSILKVSKKLIIIAALLAWYHSVNHNFKTIIIYISYMWCCGEKNYISLQYFEINVLVYIIDTGNHPQAESTTMILPLLFLRCGIAYKVPRAAAPQKFVSWEK